MADRYWVGGTGTWNSSNTANWSDTSGGVGGSSVPTAADNVFFDAGSDSGGTFVVTLDNNPRVCNDITISGLDFGMTLAGSNRGITVSGSLFFPSTNFTRTYTGTTTFNATSTGKTITTNGIILAGNISFNGVGGEWTLGSDFITNFSAIQLVNGSLDTSINNYNIDCGSFDSSNSNVRSLNLRGSTVTVRDFNGFTIATTTNLTFDAGTSTIEYAGTSVQSSRFYGGGLTYNNFSFTMARAGGVFLDMRQTSLGTAPIALGATFNNMSFSTVVSNQGTNVILLRANFVVNGTFTCNGQNGLDRYFFQGVNAACTLTCANIASMTDVDFENITIDGAAAPLSGTRLGDAGGNTGIVFDPGVNKYWNNSSGGQLKSEFWALTSGGATSATNWPLPQDTAIIENTGLSAGSTIQTSIVGQTFIGSLDMSSRTDAMTFSRSGLGASLIICGNISIGPGVTITGTDSLGITTGTSFKTLDSGGKSFNNNIEIRGSGGIKLVNNNFTTGSTRSTTLNASGSIDLNGFTYSTGTLNTGFVSTNNTVISFNGGNLELTGSGTAWSNTTVGSNLTTISGSAPGTITLTSASAKTFAGGGATYNCSIVQGGTGTLTITGSNTFDDITNSVQPTTVLFAGGTTQTVNDFTLSGTSGNLIIIDSTNASQFTLSKTSGVVSTSFLDIRDSAASGGAVWRAFINEGNLDSGNNTGWIFVAPITGNMLMFFGF